ncbi:hypothetical protein EDD18DRAFT_1360391 [Armillaria luteobubalina]|uniref:Uncharacterized protein n=1 Tax=Armillaria luteobubalina TaxID=153913 RepID=A0AA39PN50_9AGAR|nr:hypothetical protein EDD18DRAFT_1360391 [Armillaria luteobubalina]
MSTSSFALCQPLTPGLTLPFVRPFSVGGCVCGGLSGVPDRSYISIRPDGAPRSDLIPSTSASRFLSLVERAPILPAVAILHLAWPPATFELRPEGLPDRHRRRQASLFGLGATDACERPIRNVAFLFHALDLRGRWLIIIFTCYCGRSQPLTVLYPQFVESLGSTTWEYRDNVGTFRRVSIREASFYRIS